MKNFIILIIFSFSLSLRSSDELFPFGMNNTAYGDYKSKNAHCEIYKETIDSSAPRGIKWWRGMFKFTWISVEENKGEYDWSHEDSLVKWTGERDMHFLPVIGYWYPYWAHNSAAPNTASKYGETYPFDPSYWGDYMKFTQAMAERYDGDGIYITYEGDTVAEPEWLKIPINYWECMNEPYDEGNFLGDLVQYAEIFDSTRIALKRANPNAKLGGPCLIATTNDSSIWKYYENVQTAGTIETIEMLTTEMLGDIIDLIGADNIDFITHHIYRNPDIFMERLRSVRNTVDFLLGDNTPIWITEFGYLWYMWYHAYTDTTFDSTWSFYNEYYPDTNATDTILIVTGPTDSAIIYWVDTVNTYWEPSTQAVEYEELLDSIDNLLEENHNYKFLFFSANTDAIGIPLGDQIYKEDDVDSTNCGTGVCSLWIEEFTVRDPLRDNTSRPFSLLRGNVYKWTNATALPAYDTIKNHILNNNLTELMDEIETNEIKTYQSKNTISTNDFVISNGGKVAMEAGEKISLKGSELGYFFRVEEGGYFHAAINPLYGGGGGGMSSMKVAMPKGIKASNESVSKDSIPKVFSCYQNFPNPFAKSTIIKYGLPKDVEVKLDIYNLIGQKVRTLINAKQSAGYKSVSWDSRTSAGTQAPQGIYFYTFKAGDYTKHRKMILLK